MGAASSIQTERSEGVATPPVIESEVVQQILSQQTISNEPPAGAPSPREPLESISEHKSSPEQEIRELSGRFRIRLHARSLEMSEHPETDDELSDDESMTNDDDAWCVGVEDDASENNLSSKTPPGPPPLGCFTVDLLTFMQEG